MDMTCIFKRIEKKYLLSESQYESLLRRIGTHLKPDEYGRSTVLSLYLDTPDHRIIRTSLEAIDYKEKLRLRSYGTATSDSTVFLELKKKFEGIVYKRRVAMTLAEAEQYLQTGVKPFQNQIMSEIPLTALVREKVRPKRTLRVWEIILLVLGSPIWLSLLIAVFAVGLSLYIVLWSLVVCLWAVVVSLAASAVWCLFQVFLYQRAGNPGGALFAGGAALACAGLSILLVFGSLAATKGTARLTEKILLGIKALFVGKETVE